MNAIRKARCKIEQICETGDPGFRDLKPESQVKFIQQLAREALAFLPPEGETRPKHDLLFVDATPDDGYIARILSAYLDDSYYSDNTDGLPPSNPLIVKMNEWREQRNALLRAALAKLAEPAPSSEKAPTQWAYDQACAALHTHANAEKALRTLCDEFFLTPMIQEYAGANRTCMYCGTTEGRAGKAHHSAECPYTRYSEFLVSSPAPSECQSCTGQGIDCADDCMRPAPEVKHPRIHVTDKRRGAVVVDASRPASEEVKP